MEYVEQLRHGHMKDGFAWVSKEDLKGEMGLIICTEGKPDFGKEHWGGLRSREYAKTFTVFHLHKNYMWASFLLLHV